MSYRNSKEESEEIEIQDEFGQDEMTQDEDMFMPDDKSTSLDDENIELDESIFSDDDVDFEAEEDGENNYGRIYSAEAWRDLIANFKSSDPVIHDKAGELIYKALLPFIKHVAATYYSTYFIRHGEDLIAAGRLGLMESLNTYNPDKGKPTTWCFRSIIHEMREYICQEIHHTTPHYQKHLREILSYINACKMKGIKYTIEDINIATGFPKPTIENCIKLYERNRNQVSMEQFIGDNKATVADMMTSFDPSPEEQVINKESKERIFRLMKENLTEIELEILAYHHGMFGDAPKSAADISEIMNIKKQAVRQYVNMAEYKLRRAMTYDSQFNEERRQRVAKQHVENFFRTHESLVRELDSFDFDDAESF